MLGAIPLPSRAAALALLTIGAAEDRIAAGEVEPALLELGVIRAGLESLESDTLREGIEASIVGLHDQYDPCAKARREAREAMAGHHAALGEAYHAAGRMPCAWTELRRAHALHGDAARDALAAIAPQVRTSLESEDGLPPEADEPVDDAELIATFAEGRQHSALGKWVFEPGAVSSPVISTARALVIEPRGRDARAAAGVQLRVASGEGGAGIVFAAKNMHDFWMAHLEHGSEGSKLTVAHWFVNEWKIAHTETLRFSTAARRSFITLGFEILDGKVRIRAGTAAPIDVSVESLAADRVGLIATADEQREARVAFRNFRAAAPAAERKD